jgi:hypothetical protein
MTLLFAILLAVLSLGVVAAGVSTGNMALVIGGAIGFGAALAIGGEGLK